MKSILNNAMVFSATMHNGQFDRAGMPYLMHCLKVMYYTKSEDEEVLSIAVLHDVIEDTKATWEDLRKIGMTDRVIRGVECLTKMPGESYEEYKEKVKSNPDAIKVKKADLLHNSDIRRLKNKEVTEKDIARVKRYHEFYVELEAHEQKEDD